MDRTHTSVLITRKGPPDVLRATRVPTPSPGPGELLVRVHYCGVGFTDVVQRSGFYPYAPKFPFAPGYEVVGSVEEVGASTSGFAVGDRVFSLSVWGGYSEYLCRNADEFVKAPLDVDEPSLAGSILDGVTAYQLLTRASAPRPGDAVLISGASGGVGGALLQFARVLGLKAYGLASAGKADKVRALGGIPLDYARPDAWARLRELEPGGVRYFYDAIGGDYVWKGLRALSPDGKLVSFGFSGVFRKGKFDFRQFVLGIGGVELLKRVRPRRVSFFGITELYLKDKAPFREDVATVLSHLRDGSFRPSIGAVMPLSAAAEANVLVETGRAPGKIVLDCRAG